MKELVHSLVPASVIAALLVGAMPAQSAPVTVTEIGTWSSTPSGPNPGGLVQGGKFVIQATYDPTTSIEALPASEADRSGSIDSTRYFRAQLTGSNFQLYVPLQGFSTASQTGADHFFASPNVTPGFARTAEIQFFDASGTQFRGFEFESQFLPGTTGLPGGGLIFEMFTADAMNGAIKVTNSTAQMINGDNAFGVDIRSTTVDVRSEDSGLSGGQKNPGVFLSAAVPVIANGGSPVVFDINHLTQTTNGGTALVTDTVAPIVPGAVRSAPSSFDALTRQADNDLGAGRTDGQDFLTYQWSVNGSTVDGNLTGTRLNRIVQDSPSGPRFVNSGTRTVDDVNIAVAIQNSGLHKTTDTTTWGLTVTEDFTGLSDTNGSVAVKYNDALPQIVNASATAQGPDGLDLLFNVAVNDPDLAVNGIIPGFEHLAYHFFVDGVDEDAFFSGLDASETGGSQFVSNADLISEFGVGLHTFKMTVADWVLAAGACDGGCGPLQRTFLFEVLEASSTAVPEPSSLALVAIALMGLAATARRVRKAA